MEGLKEDQLLIALMSLAVMLLVGRAAGQVAKRFSQPEVLGELLAGFLLGPSVLGAVFPRIYDTLFLREGVSVALSAFSWVGAILLLLIAGIEVDLKILRAEARPGALAAAGAIVPSLLAGTLFGWLVLGREVSYAIFLGIVLSVTGVSVAAKILVEAEAMRRRYAQVIVAAGVASEVLVWIFVSVISSAHSSSPWAAALRSSIFAIGFFALMMTLGRRFTFWAMRHVADNTQIIRGQLSLVLVLVFLAAAGTMALGLHPLLGAFVVGVLLSRAPRANVPLLENIQSLATGLFAPIFFVLAGLRVDIFRLGSVGGVMLVLALLVVATVVKVGFGTLDARLGGLTFRESALVGLGLNLKGGTDVIVAIIGAELGLLPSRAYTMYAVVAILIVFISPPLIAWVAARTPPSEGERERLEREEAERRSYVPKIERVLVPVVPQLLPALTAPIVRQLATAKDVEGQIFDITEFVPEEERQAEKPLVAQALRQIDRVVRAEPGAEVTRTGMDAAHVGRTVLDAANEYDLVVIGSHHPQPATTLTFGRMQDLILNNSSADVLLICNGEDQLERHDVRRILVPVNGQTYSLDAGDIAAYLAHSHGAELVAFTVVSEQLDSIFWRHNDHRQLRRAGAAITGELAFRVHRLGIQVDQRVEVAPDAADEVLCELARQRYDLVVLGGRNRGSANHPSYGTTVQAVLTRANVPALLLAARE